MALIPSPKHITDFPPIKVFYINETITVLQIELFKILFFFVTYYQCTVTVLKVSWRITDFNKNI